MKNQVQVQNRIIMTKLPKAFNGFNNYKIIIIMEMTNKLKINKKYKLILIIMYNHKRNHIKVTFYTNYGKRITTQLNTPTILTNTGITK